MVMNDDDQVHDSQREKRFYEILSAATESLLKASRDEDKGNARRRVEDEKDMRKFVDFPRKRMCFLGKQKIDKDPQQNPNHDHASSPSLCPVQFKRRRHVVPTDPVVRIEQVRERKPVRKASRRNPVRKQEPVREGETPEWLVNVMREENGTDAKLIKEKALTMSDVDKDKTRLLIPWNGIVDMDFLNEEELKIIDEHSRKIRDKGVDVILVDSSGQQWELNLRRWNMESSSNYALVSGWKDVVFRNRLKAGHMMRIWSFRSPDRLYIALVPPDPAPALVPAQALAPVPDPAPSSPPALVV